jgi:hypothetical protein
LRARYYAPGSGRFLSADTVDPSGPGTQGYNRYAYAGNNPATLTDPSGHMAQETAQVIATAGGIAMAAEASGTLPLLTALIANPLFAVFIVVLIFAIILITAHERGWCESHGVTTCFAEWKVGGEMVIDQGRSWLHVWASAAGDAVGDAWRAVPKPAPEPGLRPVPDVPPVIPFPTRPTAGPNSSPDPESGPETRPCGGICPVPIDIEDEPDDDPGTDCYTLNRVDRIDAALANAAVAQGKANRMPGRANALVSNYMGTRWVKAEFAGSPWPSTTFRISSPRRVSFQIYLSGDGLRQYRTPAIKPGQGGIKQTNFVWRTVTSGEYPNEEHLNIDASCPNFST